VQELGELGPITKTDKVNALHLNAASNAVAIFDYNSPEGRCEQGRQTKAVIVTAMAHPQLKELRLVSQSAQQIGVNRKAVTAGVRKLTAAAAAGNTAWVQNDRCANSLNHSCVRVCVCAFGVCTGDI
jgi:hypothetical protein